MRATALARSWFAALAVKFLLLWWIHGGWPSTWSLVGLGVGDTPSYLLPIESWMGGHGYLPDYRMPGYGAVYAIFRSFCDPVHACRALILGQWMLEAASCVALFTIVLRVSGSARLAKAAFVLSVAGIFTTTSVTAILTESFTTSALVLSTALLLHARGRTWHLFSAGLLLTWAIFMRPVFVIFLPLQALRAFILHGQSVRTSLIAVCALAGPFLVLDAAWAWRNRSVNGAWSLLSNGVYYPSVANGPCLPIMRFVQAFGGASLWAEPEAEIRYFHVDITSLGDQGVELPAYITTSTFSLDSLKAVAHDMDRWVREAKAARGAERDLHDLWVTSTYPTAARIMDSLNDNALSRSIRRRMDRYRASFIAEHPWRHYVMAPLRVAGLALFRSGTPVLYDKTFDRLSFLQRVLKLLFSAHYLLVVVGGLLAALALLIHGTLDERWLAALAMTGLLVYPFMFRVLEYRYIVPVFPFLLILLVLFAARIMRRASRLRLTGPSHLRTRQGST